MPKEFYMYIVKTRNCMEKYDICKKTHVWNIHKLHMANVIVNSQIHVVHMLIVLC